MKKNILIFIISVFSLGLSATAIAQDWKPILYVGGYGGYGASDGYRDNEPSGLDYGVFAGFKFQRLMSANWGVTAAIEGNLGGSGIEDEGQVNGVNITTEKNHEYGISFRPGLTFKPSASFILNPYAIIGYRATEYDVTGSLGGFTSSATAEYDGFELGLGTNLLTYNNFDLRFEYSRTFYDANGLFSPDEDSFRFGLVYHFDMPLN
jgi:hypothetical protein